MKNLITSQDSLKNWFMKITMSTYAQGNAEKLEILGRQYAVAGFSWAYIRNWLDDFTADTGEKLMIIKKGFDEVSEILKLGENYTSIPERYYLLEEKGQIKADFDRLKGENQRLKETFTKQEKGIERLQAANTELIQSTELTNRKLEIANDKLVKMTSFKETYKEQSIGHLKEVRQLEAQNKELKTEFDNANRMHAYYQEENKVLRERISNQAKTLDSLQKGNQTFADLYGQKETQVNAISEQTRDQKKERAEHIWKTLKEKGVHFYLTSQDGIRPFFTDTITAPSLTLTFAGSGNSWDFICQIADAIHEAEPPKPNFMIDIEDYVKAIRKASQATKEFAEAAKEINLTRGVDIPGNEFIYQKPKPYGGCDIASNATESVKGYVGFPTSPTRDYATRADQIATNPADIKEFDKPMHVRRSFFIGLLNGMLRLVEAEQPIPQSMLQEYDDAYFDFMEGEK